MSALAPMPIITAAAPAERPEVVALIPAALEALRARQMNLIEKVDHACALLDGITHGAPIRSQGESLEAAYDAQRKRNDRVWANRAALDQTAKICDLTPERIVSLRHRIAEDLPRYLEYKAAVGIIEDFEADYCGDEAPPPVSPVVAKVKEAAKDRLETLSDRLSYALTAEQVALVKSIQGRVPKYRHHRKLWHFGPCLASLGYRPARVAPTGILSIPIKAPYVRHTAAELVDRCAIQGEVRAVLACWGVPVTSERRQIEGETVTVILADGWEVRPA